MKNRKGVLPWLEANTFWRQLKANGYLAQRKTDRGQIVIPKEARDLFGIKPGDTLLIVGEEDTGLIVSRPEVLSNIANQIFANAQKEDT